MPWNLKNVAMDPAYAMKRRRASKMDMEPSLGGARIRLRQMVTISDEMYDRNKVRIEQLVSQGVLTAEMQGAPKVSPKKAEAPQPKPASAPEPTPAPEPEPAPEPQPEPETAPDPEPAMADEDKTPVEVPKAAAKKRKPKKGSK